MDEIEMARNEMDNLSSPPRRHRSYHRIEVDCRRERERERGVNASRDREGEREGDRQKKVTRNSIIKEKKGSRSILGGEE